jgi:hypothetical protein
MVASVRRDVEDGNAHPCGPWCCLRISPREATDPA